MKIARPDSRVLVTGGAGFIGSHLVDTLVASGCRTTVLDNFRNGKRENLEAAQRTGLLTVVEGDITDAATCERVVGAGFDAIYHLACLGVRHSLHDPLGNHEVNAAGTLHLLQAALRATVELLSTVAMPPSSASSASMKRRSNRSSRRERRSPSN